LNFDEILDMERLLLNKINWNINLETPYEFIYQLLREISNYNNIKNNNLFEIFNSVMDLICYCFCDINVYSFYNQYVISISCLIIELEFLFESKILNDLKNFILKNLFCNQTIIDIQNCIIIIKNNLNYLNNKQENPNIVSDGSYTFNENVLEKFDNIHIENSVNNSNLSTLDLDIYSNINNFNDNFTNNFSNYSTIEVDYEMKDIK